MGDQNLCFHSVFFGFSPYWIKVFNVIVAGHKADTCVLKTLVCTCITSVYKEFHMM